MPGAKWNSMSGAGTPLRARKKPAPSGVLEASGPRPSAWNRAKFSVLAGAVEVGVELVPGLASGLDHDVDQRVHRAAFGHRQRSANAVELTLAALVVLGALEVGEDLVIAPALAPARGPLVVVQAVAPDIDHRVDRAAAAEHPPAREIQTAVVHPGLGIAQQVPVELGLEH